MNEPEISVASTADQVKPSPNDLARFWGKVSKAGPDDCWLWNGVRDECAYGICWMLNKREPAHRASWIIHHGLIPRGLWVLHDCPNGDNPSCVNPEHLWLGTNLDNIADRHEKGRDAKGLKNGAHTHPEKHPKGSSHGMAKLSDDAVLEMRFRRSKGEIYESIAKDFGVTISLVAQIASRKIWKHLD